LLFIESGLTFYFMITEIFPTFMLHLGRLKDKISDDDYFELCQLNECLVIERDKSGDFEIKSINGINDSLRNAELCFQFSRWANENKSGKCFSAFTGFTLPNGAVRASDFAWLENETWRNLSKKERNEFARVCPDFVAEIPRLARIIGNLASENARIHRKRRVARLAD
jgi:Uma2 family endonuclease